MIRDTSMNIRWFCEKRRQAHVKPTWCEEDDGHGDEGADHQDDQQSDGNPLPVPLRRTHPAQVLQREKRERKHRWVRVEKRKISLPCLTAAPSCPDKHKSKDSRCNVKCRIFVRFAWLRIVHTARLLTAPINTGHTEALYFQSNLPAQRRIYNEGLCMSHTASLKSETRCFWFVFQCRGEKKKEKRQSICTVQSSLGQPLLWITPSNLWEMHSFSRARSRTFPPLCWMLCVYDPQTERLPRLLQIKKTAGILHSRAPTVHLAAQKARFEQSEWPERTQRVMLSTVKQLSRRIGEAFSCNSIWVVVLEGLKRAPSPHLLPLIRWIKPPPTYTFPPRHSSPWPQLPTKPCRWNTVITDHQPTTSTLIGWRGGGAEWLPIRARFRFHKDALSASVWGFPLKTKLLSTSHGGLKKQHSSFLKLMVMTGNVAYIDWWANYVRSTPSYFSHTTEKQTGRTKSPATEFSAQSQG